MADKSTVHLGMDNLLEDRSTPSVAPIPQLENFKDPTATIRVQNEAQQNIVGVTREGRSAIADAFFTQGMGYGWQMSKISNGQETDPGYGSNVLGKADTYGFGTEAAPEVVRVTPSFALEVINNNQLKITWSNMNTSQGACWFRCGWLGDRIVWNPEGTTTINVPNTTGDPKFDQIGVTGPWGELWTGITYRIQGGHFTQVPSSSNYTFAGWATWSRTLPNDDIGTSGIENHGGDKTIGNVTLHTNEVLVHPGKSEDVAFTWTSQAAGTASIQAILQDARAGMGDGVRYTIQRIKADGTETTTLSSGVIVDGGNLGITEGALSVAVGVGDKIKLIVCAKGTGTDPNDDKWDTIRVVKLEVKLTEAEKTYEKVTVAPSIQLRTGTDNHSLMIDYRNMPEGVTLRAVARDHYQQTRELSLPIGTGSSWLNLNGMEPTSVVGVDVYLVHSRSEGEPVQEKKMTFQAQLGPDTPTIVSIPSTREYFGLLAQDVLKEAGMTKTNTDLEEEYAFLQYQEEIMKAPPARDWTEGQTFSIYTQEQNFGLHQFRWGPLVGNGGVYSTMYVIDGTKFNRFRVRGSQSADLLELDYFVKDGIKKVPHTCTERLADGSIVLKPVGLGHVIVKVRLNGTYSGGLYGSADNIDALRPIEGQFIDGGIFQLRAQLADPQYEGFQPMITEIQEARSPVLLPGTAVQMVCQFESKGTQGGPVSFKVTCGYTGDPNIDSVQCVVDKVFSTTDIKSFIKNVYAPNNPPTPQSRPIITVELTYADGRKQIVGQRISRAPTLNAEDQAYNKRRFDQIVAAQKDLVMVDGQGNPIGVGGNLFANEQEKNTFLQTLIARGVTDFRVVNTQDVAAAKDNIRTLYRSETTPPLNIDAQNGMNRSQDISLISNGENKVVFTMPWDGMVNFYVNMNQVSGITTNNLMPANVSLQVTGDGVPSTYISDKEIPRSGESVSLKLLAGKTYTVILRDQTKYLRPMGVQERFSVPLGINIQKFDNRDIAGRISLDGEQITYPVRMRVAEYLGNERRQMAINYLDPSKPVWVVVHGMNGSDEADNVAINKLAKALGSYSGIQVVTINWKDAAKDPTNTGLDAPWTISVGEWACNQLLTMGFAPNKINIAGHSHGTYVAHALAAKIMASTGGQQINALIALDPAGNLPLASKFDHTKINFADVSRNSMAFEGSWIAGSDKLAGTADVSFKLKGLNTIALEITTEHSLAISLLANILDHERVTPGSFSEHFSLSRIMAPSDQNNYSKYITNNYGTYFEGEIDVTAIQRQEGNSSYYDALPSLLRYKDSQIGQELIKYLDEHA